MTNGPLCHNHRREERSERKKTMANSTLWWLLASGAVVLELLSGTGTLYLLLIGGGFAAAALVAHAGFGPVTQLVTSAVVSVALVFVWRTIRGKQPAPPRSSANRDVNLDIGECVQIDAWNPDGTATVRYRGAQWAVAIRPGETPSTGEHKIVQIIGSRLIVGKI
jgi:membrane protein implicated in regulation of membrane protease activity